MAKFYLLVWIKWVLRLTVCTLVLATILASIITFALYIKQGMPTLNDEVFLALGDLFMFWLPITLSIALLIALFRSIKFIFNRCHNGYKFELLTCNGKEKIEYIGYGDLVKVWRRWLMIIIWLTGAQMIVALIFTNLFTSYGGVFEWFNIYWLFGFLLVSGYLSFILLGSRCKKVRVAVC